MIESTVKSTGDDATLGQANPSAKRRPSPDFSCRASSFIIACRSVAASDCRSFGVTHAALAEARSSLINT
jgi:hypothetical protein